MGAARARHCIARLQPGAHARRRHARRLCCAHVKGFLELKHCVEPRLKRLQGLKEARDQEPSTPEMQIALVGTG